MHKRMAMQFKLSVLFIDDNPTNNICGQINQVIRRENWGSSFDADFLRQLKKEKPTEYPIRNDSSKISPTNFILDFQILVPIARKADDGKIYFPNINELITSSKYKDFDLIALDVNWTTAEPKVKHCDKHFICKVESEMKRHILIYTSFPEIKIQIDDGLKPSELENRIFECNDINKIANLIINEAYAKYIKEKGLKHNSLARMYADTWSSAEVRNTSHGFSVMENVDQMKQDIELTKSKFGLLKDKIELLILLDKEEKKKIEIIYDTLKRSYQQIENITTKEEVQRIFNDIKFKFNIGQSTKAFSFEETKNTLYKLVVSDNKISNYELIEYIKKSVNSNPEKPDYYLIPDAIVDIIRNSQKTEIKPEVFYLNEADNLKIYLPRLEFIKQFSQGINKIIAKEKNGPIEIYFGLDKRISQTSIYTKYILIFGMKSAFCYGDNRITKIDSIKMFYATKWWTEYVYDLYLVTYSKDKKIYINMGNEADRTNKTNRNIKIYGSDYSTEFMEEKKLKNAFVFIFDGINEAM
jgi:hypothetical protein